MDPKDRAVYDKLQALLDNFKDNAEEACISIYGSDVFGLGAASHAEDDDRVAKKSKGTAITPGSLAALGGEGNHCSASQAEAMSEVGLTAAKRDGLKLCKQIKTKYESKSKNPLNTIEELVQAVGPDNADCATLKVPEHIAKWKQCAAVVIQKLEQVPNWTEESYANHFQTLIGEHRLAMDEYTHLFQIQKQMQETKMSNVHESSGKRRAIALTVRKYIGNGLLTDQGLPKSAMLYIGTEVFMMSETSKVPDFVTMKVRKVEKNDHWDQFLYLSKAAVTEALQEDAEPNEHHALLNLRHLEDSIPADRINQNIMKIQKVLGDATVAQDKYAGLTRMKMGPNERFSTLEWCPAALNRDGFRPHSFTSFGAPTLLYATKWGLRFGFEKQPPWVGLGFLMTQVRGSLTVLWWPMQSTIDSGGSTGQIIASLVASTGKDVSALLSTQSQHVCMQVAGYHQRFVIQ